MPDNTPAEDGARSRVLLVIGKALANLVAVTLRHGSYDTRDCTTERECRQIISDWKPHMALVDIDHYRKHPSCGILWCVVYDPEHLVRNPESLKDLEGSRASKDGTVEVKVLVI